jgi:divinyl protochlorophyllide a 8-vinyl-reductase
MVKAPKGYLRKPAAPDQMAPQMATDLLDAVEQRLGLSARAEMEAAAGFSRPPGPKQPVSEARVRDLHKALRATFPHATADIMREAGTATADGLVARQLSNRAQLMLSGGPWTIAAWLLGRWAKQNSWTFSGSAIFTPINGLEIDLRNNPLIEGETADHPICHFHEALFARLFQLLVDPNLTCREIACQAMGASSCRFVVALP